MLSLSELDFSVFLIHKLAEAWNKLPFEVYEVLNRTKILDDYIIECYDCLHTMGSLALIEDISGFVKEKESNYFGLDTDVDSIIKRYMKKWENINILARYDQHQLELDIISHLSIQLNIDLRKAMDIYYSSTLVKQIENSEEGIDNLDYKLLVEDLIDNEINKENK